MEEVPNAEGASVHVKGLRLLPAIRLLCRRTPSLHIFSRLSSKPEDSLSQLAHRDVWKRLTSCVAWVLWTGTERNCGILEDQEYTRSGWMQKPSQQKRETQKQDLGSI